MAATRISRIWEAREGAPQASALSDYATSENLLTLVAQHYMRPSQRISHVSLVQQRSGAAKSGYARSG